MVPVDYISAAVLQLQPSEVILAAQCSDGGALHAWGHVCCGKAIRKVHGGPSRRLPVRGYQRSPAQRAVFGMVSVLVIVSLAVEMSTPEGVLLRIH